MGVRRGRCRISGRGKHFLAGPVGPKRRTSGGSARRPPPLYTHTHTPPPPFVCLDARGQWRGLLPSSAWTRRRAMKRGQSGGWRNLPRLLVAGCWLARPRHRHSRRGIRENEDAQPSTDGLLGPARVGRSGQQVVAPRATGSRQRPVSEKRGGGGALRLFVRGRGVWGWWWEGGALVRRSTGSVALFGPVCWGGVLGGCVGPNC